MDWISVSVACSTTSDAITSTSLALNKFVRDMRECRAEIDAVSTELHSLDGVLALLRYDAASFPAPLAEQTPGVLNACLALVTELGGYVSVLNRLAVSKADKKSRWLAGRHHVCNLRWSLGEYKLALGLAVDLTGVIKCQPNPNQTGNDEDGDDELETVTARILDAVRSQDLEQDEELSILGHYLYTLQEQAVSAGCNHSQQAGHRRDGCSSLDGPPDSAIDMTYDDAEIALPPRRRLRARSASFEPWEEAIDEFVGELSEMPARPPPVPLRSSSRLGTASHIQRPSTSAGCSGTRDPRPASPTLHRPARDSFYTAVTELPGRDLPPRHDTRTHSRRSSIFGQVRYAIWENPRAEVPDHQATSGAPPSASLLRRSSSKFSSTFQSLRLKRSSLKAKADNHPQHVGDGAVFGVPLKQSMQVAKGIASTRHHNASTRTTRQYPLCILRCAYYIRDCGLEAPHIFGVDGDSARLAQLKETFGSAETDYGRDLEWSRFSVHDAAGLVLVFLSELPKPLIGESAGKRWIVLSRQATMRAARLDQGLDFWEEAFMGIHGPARALFKLLLNLWGDIADAADNDMTAERLAGRVVRPLMHSSASRHHTDFMLGLAFLIRKRSEYNLAARGVTRKSNAAFM